MKSDYFYRLGVLGGALIFLMLFYSKSMLSPNSFLFSNTGDGIKNYYTYAYQIKNNRSSTNFEGFNHPYGEHFLYTDCHPLLVALFQPIQQHFPSLAKHSIGILNALMLLSFLLSAYLLFLVLRQLTVSRFLAALGAIAIGVLSPQVFRIQGHFALSYGFVIPLCIYALLRYDQSHRHKWALLLLCLHCIALGIHAYLGMLSIILNLVFALVQSTSRLCRKKNIGTTNLLLLLVSLLPIVLFLGFNHLSDTHLYRTTNPYGFFEYYADIDTVFLPHHPPFQPILFSLLPPFTQTWEGWSYIGMGSSLLLPFLTYSFFKRIWKEGERFFLGMLFLSSILVLLFSFGIPFQWNWEEGLEHFPTLKQFRSIGRFAWIFYTVVSIASIYYLDRWVKKAPHSVLRKLLSYALPLLMMVEGIPYHQEVSAAISQSPNAFDQEQLSPTFNQLLKHVEAEHYQALLPLPFYCIGSENYEKEANGSVYRNSMLLSYHSGLPLISSYLSRTSLTESKNSMQLFAPDFYTKNMEQDLPSSLPFLIFKDASLPLTRYEEALLTKAKPIIHIELGELFFLEKAALFEHTAAQEWENYLSNAWIQKGGFQVSDSTFFFYHNSFEKDSTAVVHQGTPVKTIDQQAITTIATLPADSFSSKTLYSASIWLSTSSENGGQDDLNHLEWKVLQLSKNGTLIAQQQAVAMESPIHTENWTRVELNFQLHEDAHQLQFLIEGNHPTPHHTFANDFFVGPTQQTVYREIQKENESLLFKNNHRIKKPL